MKILIVNDDGYKAEGINILAEKLNEMHNIIVVAPRYGCSGFSHSLTFYKPIYVKKIMNKNWECFSVEGTPADCVKFAIKEILHEKPDMIISGINDNPNIGTDVFYSGTVHAAMEGAILKIPSLAVSGFFFDENTSEEGFRKAADFICKNLEMLYDDCKLCVPLNLNFPPDINNIKGVKLTKIGIKEYNDYYDTDKDEEGNIISYTLKGKEVFCKANPEDCDTNLSRQGYITISPVSLDNTDYNSLSIIKGLYKL